MKPPFWYPPILAYHRIHPDADPKTPTVSPEAFEKQMALLAQRWKPVPLSKVAESLEKGKTLPPKAVAVTFDDGTEDNFIHAFPVLTRHKIPAAIFLITGQIGQPGTLSADQIRQMAREGISFGSHGVDHEYLPSLAQVDLERTLSESKQAVEKLGIPAEFISYPGGGYTAAVMSAARRCGYRGACATNRGFQRFPPDRWALRRITMHEETVTPAGMWLRCCGYYGINRRLRAPD
jgi:peptidoglycan/xylan/chitin deacetylase (PgdA/CDA1 family)